MFLQQVEDTEGLGRLPGDVLACPDAPWQRASGALPHTELYIHRKKGYSGTRAALACASSWAPNPQKPGMGLCAWLQRVFWPIKSISLRLSAACRRQPGGRAW